MGEEGFAEALKGYVTGQEKIQEIPRRQRLIGRPGLKDLFEGDGQLRTKRDRMILKAVHEYGYSQVEVARHLRLRYSRAESSNALAESKSKDLTLIAPSPLLPQASRYSLRLGKRQSCYRLI